MSHIADVTLVWTFLRSERLLKHSKQLKSCQRSLFNETFIDGNHLQRMKGTVNTFNTVITLADTPVSLWHFTKTSYRVKGIYHTLSYVDNSLSKSVTI